MRQTAPLKEGCFYMVLSIGAESAHRRHVKFRKEHLQKRRVGYGNFSVAVNVREPELFAGQLLKLGKVPFYHGHVADIHCSVEVHVARFRAR